VPGFGDLFAHYDASKLSLSNNQSVTTWPDLIGSNDLISGGEPEFKNTGLNGTPTVELFGNGGFDSGQFTSQLDPPFTMALVLNNTVGGGIGDAGRYLFDVNNPTRTYAYFNSGSVLNFSTTYPTPSGNQLGDAVIILTVSNGTFDWSIRTDQKRTSTGSGNNSINELYIGERYSDQNYAIMKISEILIYDVDNHNLDDDIIQYAIDKYNLTF
jgi:hypothetical protein